MFTLTVYKPTEPWNKNKIVGQKLPLKLQQIWAIRIRLELVNNIRDLALFNLAIDSKLRGFDLVTLKVRDIAHGKFFCRELLLFNKRQDYQFNLNLPKTLVIQFKL
jgi:hypothetical protein